MSQVDTGWHLRLDLLKQDAEQKILSPLRTHGWDAQIEREVQPGEYLLISAKRGDRTYHTALLYSCATNNAVYKSLDKQVDQIFFNGEPYRQESFAYGIETPAKPVRDFHSVMIEWNKSSAAGKFAPDSDDEFEDDEDEETSRLLLSETPSEAIWLRLRQLHSVTLAKKMIAAHARRQNQTLSDAVIRDKAEGVAFALRNATDYYRLSEPHNMSQRVLNLYYGTMSFAVAEMLALPTGPVALSDVEDSTKLGHGLYTLDGATDDLKDIEVGILASGFFGSWLKAVGVGLAGAPSKKPRSQTELVDLPADSHLTMEALFSRIPETSDLFQEIFDSPNWWLEPTHDRVSNAWPMIGQSTRISRTYGVFVDSSGRLTKEDVARFPGPFSEIRKLKSKFRARNFRVAVDHEGLAVWWDAMQLHRSPFIRPTIIMPIFGTVSDYRAICFVLLYALSIIVRYRPSLWRRVQDGDLDHMRALIEAFLAVVERVLPQQFLEKITGQRVSAKQPGSFI